MMLDYLIPSRCNAQSEALRRASELHAISSLAVGREARKVERRIEDFRTTAAAAERRAALRAAEDAMSHMRRGGWRRDDETPDA